MEKKEKIYFTSFITYYLLAVATVIVGIICDVYSFWVSALVISIIVLILSILGEYYRNKFINYKKEQENG